MMFRPLLLRCRSDHGLTAAGACVWNSRCQHVRAKRFRTRAGVAHLAKKSESQELSPGKNIDARREKHRSAELLEEPAKAAGQQGLRIASKSFLPWRHGWIIGRDILVRWVSTVVQRPKTPRTQQRSPRARSCRLGRTSTPSGRSTGRRNFWRSLQRPRGSGASHPFEKLPSVETWLDHWPRHAGKVGVEKNSQFAVSSLAANLLGYIRCVIHSQ